MARLFLSLSEEERCRVAELARQAGKSIEEFVSDEVSTAIGARTVSPKQSGKVLTFQALKSAGRRRNRE